MTNERGLANADVSDNQNRPTRQALGEQLRRSAVLVGSRDQSGPGMLRIKQGCVTGLEDGPTDLSILGECATLTITFPNERWLQLSGADKIFENKLADILEASLKGIPSLCARICSNPSRQSRWQFRLHIAQESGSNRLVLNRWPGDRVPKLDETGAHEFKRWKDQRDAIVRRETIIPRADERCKLVSVGYRGKRHAASLAITTHLLHGQLQRWRSSEQ